ncbi:MAG: hypothetical protein M0R50_08690 [Candidatus Cloacimonetes bacterium]|jgi:hypothetical protein|nr:hypothetical protein [Candidatus Cloacimonadota bacterium]
MKVRHITLRENSTDDVDGGMVQFESVLHKGEPRVKVVSIGETPWLNESKMRELHTWIGKWLGER